MKLVNFFYTIEERSTQRNFIANRNAVPNHSDCELCLELNRNTLKGSLHKRYMGPIYQLPTTS